MSKIALKDQAKQQGMIQGKRHQKSSLNWRCKRLVQGVEKFKSIKMAGDHN